jgi:hypothetical protein
MGHSPGQFSPEQLAQLRGELSKQPSMDGNRQTADPSTILQPRENYPLPTNITPGAGQQLTPDQERMLEIARRYPMPGRPTEAELRENFAAVNDPTRAQTATAGPAQVGGSATGQQQDPKTAIQAILAKYPPGSAGLEQAMPEIQKAFPGTRFDSSGGPKDEIVIPGYGLVDVVTNAETGGKQGWSWQTSGGQPQAGGQPLGQIAGGTDNRLETLRNTPGYQFIMDEAMGALEKSAAARGTLLTGGHLKELQNRAGQIAATGFGQEFDRNLQLGQLGYNAASAQNASGSSYGGQITDLTTGAGNAQAAGTVGDGNAYNSALGGIGQNALDIWAINKRYPKGGQAPGPQQVGWNGLPVGANA